MSSEGQGLCHIVGQQFLSTGSCCCCSECDSLGLEKKDLEHKSCKKPGSQAWKVKAILKKKKKPNTSFTSLGWDIRHVIISEGLGKVLAEFLEPFSKIRCVTRSVIKVIFVQFSFSGSNKVFLLEPEKQGCKYSAQSPLLYPHVGNGDITCSCRVGGFLVSGLNTKLLALVFFNNPLVLAHCVSCKMRAIFQHKL